MGTILPGSIHTTIQNSIATVTFGHPLRNSFPMSLLAQLTAEINALSSNSSVNVIVLQSEGTGVFCSGASFDELQKVNDETSGKMFFSGFANLILAMKNCSKLIIGRVQGKAVGGGVGIIAACDYVVATTESSIKLSEIAIGIGPFVIEPVVSHKIGKAGFAKMTLEAQEWQSADWAFQKGLFSKLVNSEPELDAEVLKLAEQLSSYNPLALLEIKKLFWQDTQHWETLLFERAQISGQLVLSDFTKRALTDFKK